MHIEKLYFTLPEILDRWRITEADLIYLAENDQLRLSVRVFDVPIEFGGIEESPEDEAFRVPWEQTRFSGLLDLHACDVFQLFRCGEIHSSAFRTPRADYARTFGDADPVFVLIGDLLLTREERDRFEIATGFAEGGAQAEAPTFIHSADYQEVRCNGDRFKLGPIQAEVVRALHAAALAGEPWQNGKVILCGAGSKSLRMADVFKSQANWRRLIRSDRRGGYRLAVD
ncbi:hypothetical protein SAMN04490248_11549 [Salinihabitans flavidus]|uniref:Uncharacterized protein n=1 Tax=Salinihabitans flavidus TaxID=569882 RepID=A0A1H8TEQ7_9RHOB|nr:hypothetical protein [Salinihabitans flavidus]SEO89361.1 hypothetical protein SAMN04490248_11549 [Salinihabitans flavidus]